MWMEEVMGAISIYVMIGMIVSLLFCAGIAAVVKGLIEDKELEDIVEKILDGSSLEEFFLEVIVMLTFFWLPLIFSVLSDVWKER